MTIAIIAAFCVLVLVLAFVAPRLSRPVQQAGQRPLSLGGRIAGRSPGLLGRLLSKPFRDGNRAIARSGAAGRRGRSKLPL